MKKVIFVVVLIIIITYLGGLVRANYLKNLEKEYAECAVDLNKSIEGMKVIMFGGSNMEDKGNINSMGYVVVTRNGQNIFIDSGRDIDKDVVKFYIDKYGKIDHWIVTHGHTDHVGALCRLLNEENIEINNIYYSLLSEEWYKENDKRGYESEKLLLDSLKSDKIKNHIVCKEGQVINIDNVRVDIIREPNPEITNGDNGNEASLVFKLTAEDVNKSMIFLGDAMTKCSKELLENSESLKSDAVQMAHHGQNGVTKEVYDAIKPEVCFYNTPKWLWNNDAGAGYNTDGWKTVEVRSWFDDSVKNFVAYEGDKVVRFTSDGIFEVEN